MSQDVSGLQHFFDPKWTLQFENKGICLHDLRIVLFICSLPFYNCFRADLQDFLQKETGVHPRVTITKYLLGFVENIQVPSKQLSQSPAHSGSPSRDWQLSEQWFPGILPFAKAGWWLQAKKKNSSLMCHPFKGTERKSYASTPPVYGFRLSTNTIWSTWNFSSWGFKVLGFHCPCGKGDERWTASMVRGSKQNIFLLPCMNQRLEMLKESSAMVNMNCCHSSEETPKVQATLPNLCRNISISYKENCLALR